MSEDEGMDVQAEQTVQRTDRMMRSPNEVPTPQKPGDKRICVRECVIPGVGSFLHGQTVDDPATIAKISESPCFKRIEEVA